jgi:hypothetical protein
MPDEAKPTKLLSRWFAWLTGDGKIHKTLVAIGSLLIAFLMAYAVDYCKNNWPFYVKKVTILVPVQGDGRPHEPGGERFQDKISNDIDQTLKDAKLAFQNTHSDWHGYQAVEFQVYLEGRDKEERLRIARDQILSAAARKAPVVAVIGHTTSQVTVETAPVYAEFGISVLIPYATKTGIAEDVTRPLADGRQVPRALSFPPSNRAQANSIAEFLHNQKDAKGQPDPVRSVLIFRDAANRAYSDDCGNELVRLLENDPTSKGGPPVEIVADISVGGDIGRWYYTRETATAKADAYIIITMAKPSLEIVRQVVRSSTSSWPKLIVLTDGAIDDYLVPRIAPTIKTRIRSDDGKEVKSFPPVYIAFPESDVEPKGYDAIFQKGKGRGLSHSAYLTDAIFVASAVARNTIGETPRGDAAAVFARKLDEFVSYNKDIGASLPAKELLSEFRGDYKFLQTGSRDSDAAYTLFQIDPDTLGDRSKQGYIRMTSVLNANPAN